MSQNNSISTGLEREFEILENIEKVLVARGIYCYRASRALSESFRIIPTETSPIFVGKETAVKQAGKPFYNERELNSKTELIYLLLSDEPKSAYFDLTAKKGAFLSDEEELLLSFADSETFRKYVNTPDLRVAAFNSALVSKGLLERMPEVVKKRAYEKLAQLPEGFSFEKSNRGYRVVLPKTDSEKKGGESRGKFWKYFKENYLSEIASDLEIMSLANVGEAKARKYLEEKAKEVSWSFQQAHPIYLKRGEGCHITRK